MTINCKLKELSVHVYDTPTTVVEVPLCPGNKLRVLAELIFKLSGSPVEWDDAVPTTPKFILHEFNVLHTSVFGMGYKYSSMYNHIHHESKSPHGLINKVRFSKKFLIQEGYPPSTKYLIIPSGNYLRNREYHIMRGNILAALSQGVVSQGYLEKVVNAIDSGNFFGVPPAWVEAHSKGWGSG